jgi:hypothetical protein
LRVWVHTSDMPSHELSNIGVVNPDGTAAQFAYAGDWNQHDQPGPGNHHGTPDPQPGDSHYSPMPGPGSGGSPWPGDMYGGHL